MKVFFDSSVVFSAINSKTGAARWLIYLVKLKVITGIITDKVIQELEENLNKFREKKMENVLEFINISGLLVMETPLDDILKNELSFVDKDDLHIIVSAIQSECDYLVTFDKRHLDNEKVRHQITAVKIISPGGLLKLLAR